MTYTLGGTTLYTVRSEDVSKDAQLFQMPMPMSDSTETVVLDLFGASRNINIEGTFVAGDGSLTIAQYITFLDGLVNGVQVSKIYHSDKSGVDYKVIILSVSWKASEGAVTKLDWTIKMQECAEVV